MGRIRYILTVIGDFLLGNAVVTFLVSGIFSVLFVVNRNYATVNWGPAIDALNGATILLTLSSFSASIYRYRVDTRVKKNETQLLRSETRLRLNRILELSINLGLSDEAKESIVRETTRKFSPRYHLFKMVDSSLDWGIVTSCIDGIGKRTKMSDERKLFMTYNYASKFSPQNVQPFIDGLNKKNLSEDGEAESNFVKLLVASQESPSANFEEVETRSKEIPKKQVDLTVASLTGQRQIIDKIVQESKSALRYENLKRIVSIILNQGYISTGGLLPFLHTEGDILCIIKFEGGLSGDLPSLFDRRNQGTEMTPFKRVLLDYGFVQPSRYDWFTYLIPVARIPERYRHNAHLFMEHEIIPRVKQEWERLLSSYGHDQLKLVRYGYLAFLVKRPDMAWTKLNMQFRREFEDEILGIITPEEAARLVVTQVHSIRRILRQMEIDSVITTITDSQRIALREGESELKSNIQNELGFSVKEITDYSRLRDFESDFGRLLRDCINAKLRTRARKCDDKRATTMAKEIIDSTTDLGNLLDSLGVKV